MQALAPISTCPAGLLRPKPLSTAAVHPPALVPASLDDAAVLELEDDTFADDMAGEVAQPCWSNSTAYVGGIVLMLELVVSPTQLGRCLHTPGPL